jgi:Xaa-Pro aminopeptidase/Xaa-Pro dipeptidase
MFERTEYTERRRRLTDGMSSGLLLFIGAGGVPISSPYNSYPFRQDATFAYFFGLQRSTLAAVLDLDAGTATLYGDEQSDEDMIWHGPQAATLAEQAAAAGLTRVRPRAELQQILAAASKRQCPIHYPPPYRAETVLMLADLLQLTAGQAAAGASVALVDAIVRLREIKSAAEIEELEQALGVAREMHLVAMRHARAGNYEYAVVAEMERVLRRHDTHPPYTPIFTRRGEILHNHAYGNRLQPGDLIVNDAGAASPLGYASDITRTIPVGGRFSRRQREVYEIVLNAQQQCIAAIRPGLAYADLHRRTALQMVRGLCGLGLFRGDPEGVVDSGAYALCFPHGLGHQLGLDVHDMESYGEDLVGYDAAYRRSALFGLCNLRLAKPLRAGMVVTVEPGLYFIPLLIQRWESQGLYPEYIDYARFNTYLDFGGIRIEDDVLVTATGSRVLGPPIPKTCAEIEEIMAAPHADGAILA